MPRNSSVVPAVMPRSVPPAVVTTSPVWGLLGAAGAALALATRAPATRAPSAMAAAPSRTLVRVLPYLAMSVFSFPAGGWPQVLSLDQGPGAAERDSEESD